MPRASSAAILARYISRSPLALRRSLSSVRRTPRATVLIAPMISFCARPTLSERTVASIKLILRCCKFKCPKFSKHCAAALEFLREPRRRVLCPLACSTQLSSCHSRLVVRAANSPQHSMGSAPRSTRLIPPCPGCRPSPQAGSFDGYWPLCLHAQPALFRQLHSYARSVCGSELLAIGGHSVRLFSVVLFDRHAARRSGTSSTSRRCFRRIREHCAIVFSSPNSRETLFRGCRFIFLRTIQEKPRIPGGDWLPAIARCAAVDLVVAPRLTPLQGRGDRFWSRRCPLAGHNAASK